MCARFTLFSPGDLLVERFSLPVKPDLVPRYNIAPSQPVPVIGSKANGAGRGLAMFQWGLIPSWAADAKGPRPVNAKAETIAEKPTFRDSFRARRCLIPTDGFYEWQTTPTGKQPLFHRHAAGKVMAFAGIWDCWRDAATKRFTCAIVTTTANSLIACIHDRMPVILPENLWDRWLDPAQANVNELLLLLAPYPSEEMEIIAVDRRVNSSRVEGPECLTPISTQDTR